MKRGFTLLELLVVVGIMGLLGTISVGGYRAMQRGMADKGVMQNVNSLIRSAYQRAQVDRQPTAIFFWNETVRGSSEDDNEIVIGRAVAVRRSGRISRKDSSDLFDEFADLHLSHPTDDEETGGVNSETAFYLYPLDNLGDLESSGDLKRSLVEGKVSARGKDETPTYLSGTKSDNAGSGKITSYAFHVTDQGGVNWKVGMAYGFEFARIDLPHGYIFGSNYSTSLSDPVKDAGTLVFDVGYNAGNGLVDGAGLRSRKSIDVYSLRPNASGALTAQIVGTSQKPTDELK